MKKENELDITELIIDFNNYKNRIIFSMDELIDSFRNSQVELGRRNILEFSEGMEWLIKVHNYLLINGIDSKLEEEIIVNILLEINNALEDKDYFLVADIFEYEVREYFSSLKDVGNLN